MRNTVLLLLIVLLFSGCRQHYVETIEIHGTIRVAKIYAHEGTRFPKPVEVCVYDLKGAQGFISESLEQAPIVAHTTTNALGDYHFSNLPFGDYFVAPVDDKYGYFFDREVHSDCQLLSDNSRRSVYEINFVTHESYGSEKHEIILNIHSRHIEDVLKYALAKGVTDLELNVEVAQHKREKNIRCELEKQYEVLYQGTITPSNIDAQWLVPIVHANGSCFYDNDLRIVCEYRSRQLSTIEKKYYTARSQKLEYLEENTTLNLVNRNVPLSQEHIYAPNVCYLQNIDWCEHLKGVELYRGMVDIDIDWAATHYLDKNHFMFGFVDSMGLHEFQFIPRISTSEHGTIMWGHQ